MQPQATPTPDQYRVVLNHEEQYSLLPSYIDNPAGWRDAGFAGEREACLEYIGTHWTDMRPLSLRRHMEAQIESAATVTKSAKSDKSAKAGKADKTVKPAQSDETAAKAGTRKAAAAKIASKSAAKPTGKRG